MRLLLVSMPWQALETPSIAIGLLGRVVRSTFDDVEVAEYHANLHLGEFLLEHSAGQFLPKHYNAVGDGGFFDGLGDWVFSGVLYDDDEWGVDTLERYAAARGTDIESAVAARRLARDFVTASVEKIIEDRPDVVGFTSTFMQNVASLAVARRLKQLAPGVTVVFGGANCDGPKGHAVHRAHRFVDFVVRGEGERSFVQLLRALSSGAVPDHIQGLCWWDGDTSIANPMSSAAIGTSSIPAPDYDLWFQAFEASSLREYLVPQLLVEGARGCWWGEKHHCTFCGLNGSLMKYRSKPPKEFLEELKTMVERYRILDIVPVENIMAMDYVRELLPELAALDWDLRLHYELKANLREDQVELLSAARVVQVQFGIESLSSRVLSLMRKGVTGATNVRLLRECEEHGVTVDWNYLYGFPGEAYEDYSNIVKQIPAMVHLQPPAGASRLAIERFSPYYDDPGLGFGDPVPAEFYQHIYELGAADLRDIAHVFETEHAGIDEVCAKSLSDAVAQWADSYPESFLTMETATATAVLICDGRRGWSQAEYVLVGWQAAAMRLLRRPQTFRVLARRLADAGHMVSGAELRCFLLDAGDRGLLFADDEIYVALPTTRIPARATEMEV